MLLGFVQEPVSANSLGNRRQRLAPAVQMLCGRDTRFLGLVMINGVCSKPATVCKRCDSRRGDAVEVNIAGSLSSKNGESVSCIIM
jgi:hypothetical protein